MEQMPNSIDASREIDFDQSVDEQKQLEQTIEQNPDNEKLKARLEWVKGHLEAILAELNNDSVANNATPEAPSPAPVPSPETQQAVGQATYNAVQAAENGSNAPTRKYADKRGVLWDTPQEAVEASRE